jgi:hypothetical protein
MRWMTWRATSGRPLHQGVAFAKFTRASVALRCMEAGAYARPLLSSHEPFLTHKNTLHTINTP